MQIQVVKSKIHRVTVTEANLNYIGSITIDADLMDAANLIAGEKVAIVNNNNGERFETYIIKGERGTGCICLNGAAARKCQVGDTVIIMSYALMDFEEAKALDLFAGTGSISIELLSRGCSRVVSVEKDSDHYAFIAKVMETVKTDRSTIIKCDVFKYLERCQEQFDFIFADPPYQLPELGSIPEIILGRGILKPDGIFVLEHGDKYDFKENPRFTDMRVYGSVHFSFFK